MKTVEESPLPFTPTQQRIVDVLSDGKPHRKQELVSCLWDELGNSSTVAVHICAIRKLLPPGEDIVCVVRYQSAYYQHIRLLRSPYKE